MKNYTVSFDDQNYTVKPEGQEIGLINNRMTTETMEYTELAHHVGEKGCSFCPGFFDGIRRNDNYIGQQLVVLDFDNGITFEEIRVRAEHYRLPLLFAYKTFSYTEELCKFRAIFALSNEIYGILSGQTIIAIFMKIFEECDQQCSDCARLFFGGKGLLYLAEQPVEISWHDLQLAFRGYMCDKYDKNHYMGKIRTFYAELGVKTERNIPVLKDGQLVPADKPHHQKITKNSTKSGKKKDRTKRTRNFNWETLYERCRLFRQFADGTEYYYYPQLFLLATNLINIENGKREFMRILELPENAGYEAYHKRNWYAVLNLLRDENYHPQSCADCPYADECSHQKNLILTAKPGRSDIRIIEQKEYCSIEEAEQSLSEQFSKAVSSEKNGIHLIIAQTGLGKTHIYLNYLVNADKPVLIAVPTHNLKNEIYQKAKSMGISNIMCIPEMPQFSDALKLELNHNYSIGAGAVNQKRLYEIFQQMKPNHPDYEPLKNYLCKLDRVLNFKGHIITTHERFLYMQPETSPLDDHELIVDEDILRTVFATETVSNEDIRKAMECPRFSDKSKERMKEIVSREGFHQYEKHNTAGIMIDDELLEQLDSINTNVVDLLYSRWLYNNGTNTVYIKVKPMHGKKIIIMSATANVQIYRMLLNAPVYEYCCKMAEYRGEIKLYTRHTFSRYSLKNSDSEVLEYIRNEIGDSTVITFKAFEHLFNTSYHFGAVEGLNCLEGENIAVIGLPNVDETVYKLYGMAADVDPEHEQMRLMRVQYNGYEFFLNTFSNYKLRTIQLWMLESMLEQAVGRARLLRYDCEVKVFARFPIDQAMIMQSYTTH